MESFNSKSNISQQEVSTIWLITKFGDFDVGNDITINILYTVYQSSNCAYSRWLVVDTHMLFEIFNVFTCLYLHVQ